MSLSKKDRETLEGSIFDAHFAAEKYLESGKDIHKKLLVMSVQEAIENLQILKEEIKKDEMVGNYKLHLLVPIQIVELLRVRGDIDEKSEKKS